MHGQQNIKKIIDMCFTIGLGFPSSLPLLIRKYGVLTDISDDGWQVAYLVLEKIKSFIANIKINMKLIHIF